MYNNKFGAGGAKDGVVGGGRLGICACSWQPYLLLVRPSFDAKGRLDHACRRLARPVVLLYSVFVGMCHADGKNRCCLTVSRYAVAVGGFTLVVSKKGQKPHSPS